MSPIYNAFNLKGLIWWSGSHPPVQGTNSIPFPCGYTILICIRLRSSISGTEHHLSSPLAVPLIMGKLHREKKDKKINSTQVHRNFLFPSSKSQTHVHTHMHMHPHCTLQHMPVCCSILSEGWLTPPLPAPSSVGSYINHSTHFAFACLS